MGASAFLISPLSYFWEPQNNSGFSIFMNFKIQRLCGCNGSWEANGYEINEWYKHYAFSYLLNDSWQAPAVREKQLDLLHIECNQDKKKRRKKQRSAVVLNNITEFASWLSIPGMEVITLRNTSIPCTDFFLFRDKKG